jgi:drug/metabolite transporter (DMT)-like permease
LNGEHAVNSCSHTRAVLEALFVTFLWSTSWVLIKIGLNDIPALTFAGLRYLLALLCLLPWVCRPSYIASLRRLSSREWMSLIALGIVYYAVTQGAQFVGLVYLPAITVSLLLTLTAIAVPLFGIALLAERPSVLQWGGVFLFIIGAFVYFYPIAIPASEVIGYVVVLIGVLANALSSILGRFINHNWNLSPLLVTAISMGVGAGALLSVGLFTHGLPRLEVQHWVIVIWLAMVNTALAFTLWNRTLQTLTAVESSIINNTMLVQIAILAWLFLGEALTAQKIVGMAFATGGTIVVQWRRQPQKSLTLDKR